MHESDSEEDAITGINVTPLVDITLVLLIIFMVTARFISEPSLGVNLPKASASAATKEEDRRIYLTVNAKREIFLNNAPVTEDALGQKVRELLKEKPGMSLVLRADKSVSHGDVMRVLDIVRNEGVTQFGIAVEGDLKQP
ncbi:MAG TPA: biopolymer transporter ExbD [Acidobacteriota bacterium]|nr:biopolymer transporter ExbD [Acidobacteriota bacterium]